MVNYGTTVFRMPWGRKPRPKIAHNLEIAMSNLRWLTTSVATLAMALCPAIAADENQDAQPIDPVGVRGSLVICGGGRLGDSIINRFMELAGGREARLVVIPTASNRADKADDESILGSWRKRSPQRLTVLHTRDRELANRLEFVAPLQDATAVWISGGSQSLLAEAYVGTRVEKELYALLERNGVVGGTSAGAAIMSRTMIASGNPDPVIKKGLGLLPRAVIDQHFLVRKRQPRSIKAVTQHPDHFGVGIDESTAVEVSGNKMRVLGDSVVTITLAASESEPLRTFALKEGQVADLSELREEASGRAREN
jgi:cyanophycinase